MASRAAACSAGEGRLRRALAPHDGVPCDATDSSSQQVRVSPTGGGRAGCALLGAGVRQRPEEAGVSCTGGVRA
ncbi:MAG TPA: hypothetical protein VM076_11885 [Gemmatimonadaceae bacterium]|nr:hypothetical protein [Gemmatimonadaceae bacterium]